MRVYHMSDTLKLGDTLIPDHKHTTALPSLLCKRWTRALTATTPWY